ncbi:MAG: hypothetical protein AAB250_19800, partial [Bdellovibrionota bacterium]
EKSIDGAVTARKLTKKDRDPNRSAATSILTSLYVSERDVTALGDLQGNKLCKRRYAREDGLSRIVFDVFEGKLAGLILAEIEFLDDDACARFVPPDSSWQEVTGVLKYSGGALAASQLE